MVDVATKLLPTRLLLLPIVGPDVVINDVMHHVSDKDFRKPRHSTQNFYLYCRYYALKTGVVSHH